MLKGNRDTIILFAATVLGQFVLASECRTQISPGKLAGPHAFLEGLTNCVKCHELGHGPSEEKCLDCHLEIKLHLKAKRGLHYKAVTLDRESCISCHGDHAGRKFQMIHWANGQENFEHEKSGFTLNGKHGQLECNECHKPELIQVDLKKLQPKINLDKSFLGLKTSCRSCHKDEHQMQLDKNCRKCHSEKAWKPASKFDHNQANFQLTGKHLNVECAKCHPSLPKPGTQGTFAKFTRIEFSSCVACHKDEHQGKFGNDCRSCHNTGGWREINPNKFDHSKTDFLLLGKHKQVTCNKCHTSGNMLLPLQFDSCVACHKDVHAGKFKQDCKSCHNENGWKNRGQTIFDHTQTGFTLHGRHVGLDCVKCHKSGDMLKPIKSKQCSDCHQDIHEKQFVLREGGSRCESCHNEQGFIPTLFGVDEHKTSRFPLTGSHLATPCVACHKMVTAKSGAQVRQFIFSQILCKACHQDPHLGQFSRNNPVKACENCHKSSGWSILQFIHDRDSRFKLEGAHRNVACERCHIAVNVTNAILTLYKPINPACETCHLQKKLR